jgi:hypothetical protein
MMGADYGDHMRKDEREQRLLSPAQPTDGRLERALRGVLISLGAAALIPFLALGACAVVIFLSRRSP